MALDTFNSLIQELRQKHPQVDSREPGIDVMDRFSFSPQVKQPDYYLKGVHLRNHYGLNEPYLSIWLSVAGDRLYSDQAKVRDIYARGKSLASKTTLWVDFSPDEFEREATLPLKYTYSLHGGRSAWLEFRPDEIFEAFVINDKKRRELTRKAADIYTEFKTTKSVQVLEKVGAKFSDEQKRIMESGLQSMKGLPFGTANQILVELLRQQYQKGNIKQRRSYQPKSVFDRDPMLSDIDLEYTTLEDTPMIRVKSADVFSEYASQMANILGLKMYELSLSFDDMKKIAKPFGRKPLTDKDRQYDSFLLHVEDKELLKVEKILGRRLRPSETDYAFKPVNPKDKKSLEQAVEVLRKGYRMLGAVELPELLNYEPNSLNKETKITLQAANVPPKQIPKIGRVRHFDIQIRKRENKKDWIGWTTNSVGWKYDESDKEDEIDLDVSLSDSRLLPLQVELCEYFGILPKQITYIG